MISSDVRGPKAEATETFKDFEDKKHYSLICLMNGNLQHMAPCDFFEKGQDFWRFLSFAVRNLERFEQHTEI